MNETIYGIWNTTAGHNSYPSSVGLSMSNYPAGQGPQQAFDGNTSTKYVNFGVCNSTVGANMTVCGDNTGLYFSPRRGISLLLGFRFCTPDSYPGRDPMLVTFEGSNQTSTTLTLGSSWTLIYNGTSGLANDPGRFTCGITQWLSNNSIWYTSYRMLVVSKRSTGNFVQYSELELFSY
jgi:hypothetical protein